MAGLQFFVLIVDFLPVFIGASQSVETNDIDVESTVDKGLSQSDSFFDVFQAEALEVGLEHYLLVRDLVHILVPA